MVIKHGALECGKPGCPVFRLHSREEPARGVHLTVAEHHGMGGVTGVKVYACCREHVSDAVEIALVEAYGDR